MTHPERHAHPWPIEPGEIRYAPEKSLWLVGWAALWVGAAPWATTCSAVAVWAGSTAICLCFGHSVGLHRGVIHRAFRMHRTTERILVWLAVLCGMDGPLGLYRMHELRDGWQNRPQCPAYYSYQHGLFTDFWWYLHMVHVPRTPAPFATEPPTAMRHDPFYRWLERWWRWQQLPVAGLLFAVGGPSWVVWGVAGRITTAVIGHWLVNYFAHTHGDLDYAMDAGEEGRNNRWFGLLSMGEGWHNNHHAFPRSARIGIEAGQWDPGWWAIRAMRRVGLVWAVQQPDDATRRPGVTRLGDPCGPRKSERRADFLVPSPPCVTADTPPFGRSSPSSLEASPSPHRPPATRSTPASRWPSCSAPPPAVRPR